MSAVVCRLLLLSFHLPGGSIDRLLCEFGPFGEEVIVKYLKQVVMGVAYLHENRVIHRDLKGAWRQALLLLSCTS